MKIEAKNAYRLASTLLNKELGESIGQPTPNLGIGAALNYAIAILSRQIDLPHQDPADRFLAATAIYYDLILATVDANLTGSSALQTIS